MLNFFIVSFTLYYWLRDFNIREAVVINKKYVAIIFIIMNIFVALNILTAFLTYKFVSECQPDEGGIQKWNTWICIVSNLLLAVFVLAFGLFVIRKYRFQVSHFFTSDSKKSFIIFLICSGLLIFENVVRFVSHLYYPITHKYMNDILYQSLIHYLPDFIEMISICLFFYILILI